MIKKIVIETKDSNKLTFYVPEEGHFRLSEDVLIVTKSNYMSSILQAYKLCDGDQLTVWEIE